MKIYVCITCILTLFYSGIQDVSGQVEKLIDSLKAQNQIQRPNATQVQGQQIPACPTFFADPALQILTQGFSNMDNFKNVELAPFLEVRYPGSPGNIRVREYIKAQFLAFGWQVAEDPFVALTPFGPAPFVNVIATINPNAPLRLIFACHFDSKLSPPGFVGAMDSAVPCALLVNLARQLTIILNSLESDVTIEMIFFDGEEALYLFNEQDSLYGSRHLAEVWFNTLDRFDNTKNKLQNIVSVHSCCGLSRIVHLITSPFPPTWHTLNDSPESMDDNVMDDMGRILRIFTLHIAVFNKIQQISNSGLG
ncbi:glutaminyl-peptide cyclotransferase-like [Aplysia californica]|uniref:glutaminyl-peptide cyclotransferase n=1 Tax=Aplysia californica TaxID=6500 RepID=A0ABM0ZUE2_APLCA|nr:glutaminyl-peptide cyclotransferase-like [Aplysia californica]